MFKELAALLRKGDTILGTIALINDAAGADGANAISAHPRFRLTVHPKLADLGELASKVLGKPFAIEGTADELDVELPLNLTGFATTTNSQRDVFAQLEADSKAAIEEARKAAEETRKKAAESKAKPATPAAKPTAKPAAPAKPAAGKPAAPAAGKPAAAKPTTPAPQPAGKPGTPTPTPLANTNLPAASTSTDTPSAPPKIDIF